MCGRGPRGQSGPGCHVALSPAFLQSQVMLPAPFGEFFRKTQVDPGWTHYYSPQDGPNPARSIKGSQLSQSQAHDTEVFKNFTYHY